MLMIRLQRVGRKHEPVFRLVLTDSKNGPKSGKFLEVLGNYDARRKDRAEFKEDRVKYWISQGAKVSDTVHNVLVDKKFIDGKKINKLPKKQAIKKAEPDNIQKSEEVVVPETQSTQDETTSEETVEEKSTEAELDPEETEVKE